MEVSEAINKRRSIRSFSNKKVKIDYIVEAIDAARKAPLAGNFNNIKYLIVSNQKTLEDISIHLEQDFINQASHAIIVCSNPKHSSSLFDNKAHTYTKQQVGASIQNILLTLTNHNIASCWVAVFEESKIKKTLNIPQHHNIEAIIPLGYLPINHNLKTPKKSFLQNIIQREKHK